MLVRTTRKINLKKPTVSKKLSKCVISQGSYQVNARDLNISYISYSLFILSTPNPVTSISDELIRLVVSASSSVLVDSYVVLGAAEALLAVVVVAEIPLVLNEGCCSC